MIEYVITVVIILGTLVYFQLIRKPRMLYDSYKSALEKANYKVYAVPFSPLGIPLLKTIQKDTKQGDAMKITKTIYPNCDVLLVNSFNKIVLDFTHPDFIKDFYSTEHLYDFPKLKMMSKPIERAMGSGIPFSEGDIWKKKRRIITKVFTFEFVLSKIEKMRQLCEKAIVDIEKTQEIKIQNGQSVIEYDVVNLTVRMFSSIILECFLGGSTDQTLDNLPIALFVNKLIADVVQQAFDPIPFIFGFGFLNLGLRSKDRDINRRIRLFREWGLSFIKAKVQKVQQKIKKNPEDKNKPPQDIIEALVKSRTQSPDDLYTQQQILEEFSTFFVAGTDTTSHYVMMMIYYLAQNPNVEQKLREQIENNMATNDFSHENLKKLKYLEWVQQQTTRMYGPANSLLIRQTQKDTYLNNIPIRKGTYVTIQQNGNHYSQKYFPDPFVFRPERWENECNDIPKFALGGFSAGPRTCIGKNLALIESKIGLVIFMKRYKKLILPKEPMKMVIKFVYSPQYFRSKMIINQQTNQVNQCVQ